ncbi:hypothetical protein DNTS_004034 [Danionella cerebrum]|uniref:BTB domain-containing protein n=2 Tax=Euteleostomi TaxID=117571 RepID=A0A553RID3_9TELE|nr:hypothetical protein DNTS_004034 [Danionella translucida]
MGRHEKERDVMGQGQNEEERAASVRKCAGEATKSIPTWQPHKRERVEESSLISDEQERKWFRLFSRVSDLRAAAERSPPHLSDSEPRLAASDISRDSGRYWSRRFSLRPGSTDSSADSSSDMADADQDLIGIPFPNHSNDILCSLNEQRRDGLLCDVILVVRDQEYRTHRSVLAACSQYFKKLFTVANEFNRSANAHAVYELDFVAPESLTAILEFAYTSTLTVTASNVKEILSAAKLLEIPCIINVCLEIMDTGGGGGGPGDCEEFEGDDEDEEDEEEDDSKDGEYDDNESERSVQEFENQEGKIWEESGAQSPSTSSQKGSTNLHKDPQEHKLETKDAPRPEKPRGNEGLEGKALKDFSIESLLQEGLYSKVPGLERGAGHSPFLPGYYPPIWASEFPGYPQLLDHGRPYPNTAVEHGPLDLAVKKEVKEEVKEEPMNPVLHRDFLKDFMSPGLGTNNDPSLGPIKEGSDLRSYLSFISASHLGTLFPPWQLEEERKLKPKASQQCPICNKVIQGAGKLPRHMRTHTGEKPYMCSICEVRFTRQDKLKIHMRKHTGERPYICLHCNSKFVHNYDLKNHLRIHTGVRPYQCEHCYKSFTRSDHLHRHLKRQSCRVSRPRRGRKPSGWRTAGFLFPNDSVAYPSAPMGEKTHESSIEDANGKLVSEDMNRKRGVFAFAMTSEDVLPHPRFYSATSDPWGVRLERAPLIPEAANFETERTVFDASVLLKWMIYTVQKKKRQSGLYKEQPSPAKSKLHGLDNETETALYGLANISKLKVINDSRLRDRFVLFFSNLNDRPLWELKQNQQQKNNINLCLVAGKQTNTLN